MPAATPPAIAPPAIALPALHASHAGVWLRVPDKEGGETRALSKGEAVRVATDTPVLVLGAPLVASRLGYPELSGLDLLEAFAFIHPARFIVPSPAGLAAALGLPPAADDAAVPALLQAAAAALLATCGAADWAEREGAWTALQALQRQRWGWANLFAQRIARPARAERWLFARLAEWEEAPERPQPAQVTLAPAAVAARLASLTDSLGGGQAAEPRPGQKLYAAEAARIFAPRRAERQPHVALAEAGTGTGKTLAYLAPATLWSEASGGTVWVSTFTKALQRQLRRESARAFRDAPAERVAAPVVVRKGRENYLCLLNLEDALQGGFPGRAAIFAQLVARWAAYTADGDMVGGDLPGWLPGLFRGRGVAALTDRRGECIHAGCPHYRKCFIERSQRAAARARLVIANHALVMVNAARGLPGGAAPTRIIFDEGHHVFHAADATFATGLTGAEGLELRRWVLGPEGGGRGRRRGLAARLADVASYDKQGGEAIAAACQAAHALAAEGWLARVQEGAPAGAIERLLGAIRQTVLARNEGGGRGTQADTGYGLETEVVALDAALVDAAGVAQAALAALRQPLVRLGQRLEAIRGDPPDWLDGPARARIEGAEQAIGWRADLIAGWEALLARFGGPPDPAFVDWLAVERIDAREIDVGVQRRWLDPSRPFAATVLAPAHGALITSATLRDAAPGAGDDGWAAATAQSGAAHLGLAPACSAFASPFDYASQARVLIVTDVARGDIAALAGAYGRLIEAAGGGVLGLFTAIRRLRAVHARIADRLARGGLPLYAQHVDPLDTGTLVDLFRAEPNASLLGTDALRDGVDVPGESLRLVVMEQVPWPKPSILHRARRLADAAGGQVYDDRIIRARLAQAFGRLIRRRDDHGHFVVLSAAFPSRLRAAFPPGTPVSRVTLAEALAAVAAGHAAGCPAPGAVECPV